MMLNLLHALGLLSSMFATISFATPVAIPQSTSNGGNGSNDGKEGTGGTGGTGGTVHCRQTG